MNNGLGRIFGLKRQIPGGAISASEENRKAGLLQQIANLRCVPPLWMIRRGTGVELGITLDPPANSVQYPCRVEAALLSGDPMVASQYETPVDPSLLTYRLRADERASGTLPPGLDFTVPLRVRYGRTFGDAPGSSPLVFAARPNSLCFVSSYLGVPELEILDERPAVRICTPAVPTPPADPPPAGLTGNPQVGSDLNTLTLSGGQTVAADPQMASTKTSATFHLAADVAEDSTGPQYVGDADFVAVTGSMQLNSIKAAWGRDLWVEWSADGRLWKKAQKTDPTAGTKSDAIMGPSSSVTGDDFISLDVREGVQFVRARWDPAGTLLAAGTKLEIRITSKRGTAR